MRTSVRNHHDKGRRLGLVCSLLIFLMVGLAVAGPSGVMAWSESNRQLAAHTAELQQLRKERQQLRNRIALVDPRHVDPDMAGELVRRNMNVIHPDEMVILLDH